MRLLSLPARYAREAARVLEALARQAALDEALRDESLPGYFEDDLVDCAAEGTIYLAVFALPDDADVAVAELPALRSA